MTGRETGAKAPQSGSGGGGEGVASPVSSALFALLEGVPAGKSVSPEAVARAAAGDGWRRVLGQVRAEAVGLARLGRIVITRHGRRADPDQFKGVYRLRLPLPEDLIRAGEDPGDVSGMTRSAAGRPSDE